MFVGWREFDDSKVHEINETRVTTKAAYVLFYRRRPAPPTTLPASVSPASVPTDVSAHMLSKMAADPQATVDNQVTDDENTTTSANIKTVIPPTPAEYVPEEWHTDMEAMD